MQSCPMRANRKLGDMKNLLLTIGLCLITFTVQAQMPGQAQIIRPTATGVYAAQNGAVSKLNYIMDGDSHAWRNGHGREGKLGSVFGKTGIIEGWAVDAHNLSGGRLNMIANYGVGGESSTQVRARIGKTAASKAPWIVISVGHNDVRLGVPLATTISNIQAMIWWHRNIQRRKVMLVTPPRTPNGWGGMNAAAAEQQKAQIATFVRIAGADAVLDLNAVINPALHLTNDNVHLKYAGGKLAGQYFNSYFKSRGYR